MNTHYPGLLLTCSPHEAHWYKVHEQHVEKIDSQIIEKASFTDNEGQVISPSGQITKQKTSEPAEEEKVHMFIKQCAEKILSYIDDNEYKHIVVLLPEHIKNEFLKHVPSSVDKKSIKLDFGNYTHAQSKEILDLYKENLKKIPK